MVGAFSEQVTFGKDRSQNGIGNGVNRFFALRLALFNELKHYEPGECVGKRRT